jgi:hypothetical protein
MQYHIDQYLFLKMLFPFIRVVQRGTKSSFFTRRNIRFSPIVSNKSSDMFTVISTSRIQKCSFINPTDYVIVESELLASSWSLTGQLVRRQPFPPQRNCIPKHEDDLICITHYNTGCKWLTAIVRSLSTAYTVWMPSRLVVRPTQPHIHWLPAEAWSWPLAKVKKNTWSTVSIASYVVTA